MKSRRRLLYIQNHNVQTYSPKTRCCVICIVQNDQLNSVKCAIYGQSRVKYVDTIRPLKINDP